MSVAASRGTGSASPPAPVRWLGRAAVHPVLFALYPALVLWSGNATEARPDQVTPTVVGPLLATVAGWVVVAVALRSARRGALVASIGALLVLFGGVLVEGAVGPAGLLVAAVTLVLLAVVLRPVEGDALLGATAVANIAAVVLVALTLPPVLAAWGPFATPAPAPVAARDDDGAGVAGRDIWYVIPDRYPRADTLQEVFGFDNTPFLSVLEERGFQVADASLANYPKTAESLAATWNMAALDELVPVPPDDPGDWQPLYALLRDAELGRVLVDAGYEYTHVGTWWDPTAVSDVATTNLRLDDVGEFERVWRRRTLLPTPPDQGEPTLREANRRTNEFALDELDRLAATRTDTPRFVLAHLTLPHPPYAFGADGGEVTEEELAARTREELFTDQLTYLNTRLERLVATLTSGPEATWPVIVVQSDEGPHPVARTSDAYDWTTAPTPVLEEKLRTLSAILLPASDLVLPEDLTGIDTWRLVLDDTIGTDYGPATDVPVSVFPGDDDLYTWVDVRDRVR